MDIYFENVRPVGKRVLVKLFALPKEVKVNGIIIPVELALEKKFRIGRVLSVGSDVIGLNDGDKILMSRQFGLRINKAGPFEDDYRIVSCDQIEGTVSEDLDSDEFWLNQG